MNNDELIPRLRHDSALPDDEFTRGIDLRYLSEAADTLERMQVDPQPTMWAACSTCDMAYVLRRALSMSKGWMWVWARECKHRSEPVLMNAQGRLS